MTFAPLVKVIKWIDSLTFRNFFLLGIILTILANIVFYQVLFDFIPQTMIYDINEQVLKITSDARHYVYEIRLGADKRYFNTVAVIDSATFVNEIWNTLKKLIVQLTTSVWGIALINAICIYTLQFFLSLGIMKNFQVSRVWQKRFLLLLFILPTQYSWLLQPIKDGWVLLGVLIPLYVSSVIVFRLDDKKSIIAALISLFLLFLIIGIARKQAYFMLIIPIISAIPLIWLASGKNLISNDSFRIFLAYIVFLIFSLFPLQSLNTRKEVYYSSRFADTTPTSFTLNEAKESEVQPRESFERDEERTRALQESELATYPTFVLHLIQKFHILIEVRNFYLKRYTDANTYVDPVEIYTLGDGLRYIPRSVLIGAFTPINVGGEKSSAIQASSVSLQLASVVEIVLCMGFFLILTFYVCWKRLKLAWLIVAGMFYFLPGVTMIAFSMPNAGVIVRQRFPYLYVLMIISFVVFFHLFLKKCKEDGRSC